VKLTRPQRAPLATARVCTDSSTEVSARRVLWLPSLQTLPSELAKLESKSGHQISIPTSRRIQEGVRIRLKLNECRERSEKGAFFVSGLWLWPVECKGSA
jgi:hypothetical protein